MQAVEAVDQQLRKELYDASTKSPAAWLIQAVDLRDASKFVDWLPSDPQSNPVQGNMVIYRLLMSLSLENLLKGILVAYRVRSGETNFSKGIYTHRLEKLAEVAATYGVAFTDEELGTLAQATSFIEWAGRYPFPKFEHDYGVRAHSSVARGIELQIWNRLFDHLKEVGWVSKGVEGSEGWYFLLTRCRGYA